VDVRKTPVLLLLALASTGCVGRFLRLGAGACHPVQPSEATTGWSIDFDDITTRGTGWRVGYCAVSDSNDRLSTVDAGFVFQRPAFPVEARAFHVDMGLARHSIAGQTAWGPVVGVSYHMLIGKMTVPILSMRLAYSPVLGEQDFPFSDVLTFSTGLSLWYFDDGA